MILTDLPKTYMTEEKAGYVASVNNVNDDDWRYVVRETGRNNNLRFVVDVYDESNYMMGTL